MSDSEMEAAPSGAELSADVELGSGAPTPPMLGAPLDCPAAALLGALAFGETDVEVPPPGGEISAKFPELSASPSVPQAQANRAKTQVVLVARIARLSH